jgi:hypothetical protein
MILSLQASRSELPDHAERKAVAGLVFHLMPSMPGAKVGILRASSIMGRI